MDFDGVDTSTTISDWKEGVEQYRKYSQQELWEMLGLGNTHAIPFFQKKLDVHGTCQPWTEEGEHWLSTSPDAQPLRVKWHQLVGMIHLLDQALQGKPVLLMDEVGVGKTMQAVGLIALLTYFREFYVQSGHFPGRWSMSNHPRIHVTSSG